MTDTMISPAPVPPAPPEGTGRLWRLTAGASATPLAVLFGLNLVDEFDRAAFSTLLPNIRDAFGLSDQAIQNVLIIPLVFTLLASLPIGILADRLNRVRLCVGAAALWGVCAVLTGVVPALALLYLVRFGAGLGRIINEVVHPSLLGDYYPRRAHPNIFGVHRSANALGNVAGPVAGIVAAAIVWEAAFFLLAIPTGVLLVTALVRLREPARGATIDEDLAAAAAGEEHTSFSEARRQLFAIRTLRRLWFGAFLFGIGTLSIGGVLSLFFEQVFDFDEIARGWITFTFGAGEIVGLILGARWAGRATGRGDVQRLAWVTGASFAPFVIGMFALSASPVVPLAVVSAFVLSVGLGTYQPPYYSLVGMVAPPKVRSQAYAWAVLFFGCGGIFYGAFLAGIGEDRSYRTLTLVLAVITGVAGLVGISAQRFVKRDYEQAEATLSTAIRIREELERSGERPLLVCRNVEVAYGQVQILFGVDMEVQEGEIIALLGTNGAGKSTLLKAISGLVDPIGGAIFFDGRDITHADAVQTSRMGIVQVPGGKAVFPTLTVAEHFKSGTWLFADEDPAEVQRRIEEVLQQFPRLRERWDQMAGNLSGGEQQQLAVGMAFVAKPRLLIIDELSLGLAPTIVEQLLEMVRAIHAQGCTIILVEQSVNVALTIAEKAYFLEKGEVRFSGPTAELLERGDILRAVFLEGAGSVEDDGSSSPAAKVRSDADFVPLASRPVVLRVAGLTRRFGGITAVNDVSFDVRDGEILGLIGPNGAGKTTIFDLISGHLPLDSGRLELLGRDITDLAANGRAALGLGRSFQDARIFPSLTVAENIALGLERHIEVRDHLSALLQLPAAVASERDVAWTVDDLIELMNLGAFRNKFVAELSTGSRRIVDLAMSIAHDPKVLLLDEPSSGIAQKETEALGPLLKRIQRETGCAMLVIEHDMPLITSISDEILALELGTVVTRGLADEVLSDPRVVSAYLGGDVDVIHRSGGSKAMAAKAEAPAEPARRGSSRRRRKEAAEVDE